MLGAEQGVQPRDHGVDKGAELVLSWARVIYRYRALRRLKSCSWLPASVFVTVLQPVEDGGLIVGRNAGSTASPGR
ncbi:hypothetical protein C7C46_30975 [Streptomyces tateyamensis]|uniref:Uncharacterized protein n=1 Tax=Streptomyces tateyamensis TaxID=565073 RepID=A0A2V4N567_9ACTN|nr:hypothetical protein [Streptomyces tateyamensis]PYC66743.1 hypothetical protein C7C46_30975 [Streptomyces tateyamensis]